MSFKIKETVKWQEEMLVGKLVLFERIVTINEIPGKNLGLKFLVDFKRTEENNPEMKIILIEGGEILKDFQNNFKSIGFQFESMDGSGQWWLNSTIGCNVDSLIKGFSCASFENVAKFRKAHAMINSKSITYTMTFDLELEELVNLPKAKRVHEKLYLDSELSDVKIICEDKIFHSHKIVLSCQSSVFKSMLNDSDMVEAKSGEIKIPDISPITIENLLFFMYHDNLDEHKISGDLMLAADKYNISALYKFCVNHLDKNLAKENAVDVMNSSYLKNENELFAKACKFVLKNKLIGKEAWKDMNKNNPDYVVEILDAMF